MKSVPPISPKMLFWLFMAVLVVGGFLTIRALSTGSMTANESLLLSVLLTIFSIGAGWLISHTLYHDSRSEQISEIRIDYEKNLEIYAVKASEKVINLSNQIARVVEYLGDSPKADDANEVAELKSRHIAAIHMLGTLKSINDTSLSDWEGVIGDRLDAKRKIDQQRDYDINAILEEIRGLSQELNGASQSVHVEELVKELKRVSAFEAVLPPPRNVAGMRELSCPECNSPVQLKVNRKGKIGKTAVACKSCGKSLAIIGGGTASPKMEVRQLRPESVDCPDCGEPNAILLDNVSPSQTKFHCAGCNLPLVAQRLHVGGVKIKIDEFQKRRSGISPNIPSPIDAEFLKQVEMLLPGQPWPSGIHREIAEKLDCTPSKVSRATGRLIDEGKFSHQVDGKLVKGEESE